MGRTFADCMATDLDQVFLNTDYFGESITHTPHDLAPVSLAALCSLPDLPEHVPAIADSREGLQRIEDGYITLKLDTPNLTDGQNPSKFRIRGHDWFAVGIAIGQFEITVTVRHVRMSTLKRGHVSSHQSQ